MGEAPSPEPVEKGGEGGFRVSAFRLQNLIWNARLAGQVGRQIPTSYSPKGQWMNDMLLASEWSLPEFCAAPSNGVLMRFASGVP